MFYFYLIIFEDDASLHWWLLPWWWACAAVYRWCCYFMIAMLLSWDDDYCLMRGDICMILSTIILKHYVIICTCYSTIVNCTMLFWIISFLMAIKKKICKVFYNISFFSLLCETWSNLDLQLVTKKIVISIKNCSIVHICNKFTFIQKVWI